LHVADKDGINTVETICTENGTPTYVPTKDLAFFWSGVELLVKLRFYI